MLGSADDTHELALRLNALGVHLLRRLRKADVGTGLAAPQLSALSLLVSAGRHTIGDLAGYEQVTPPTMTYIVNALEALGLVARLREPGDRRVVYVEATPEGRATVERGRTARVTRLAADLETLSPGERKTLEDAARILMSLPETLQSPVDNRKSSFRGRISPSSPRGGGRGRRGSPRS
jgi:DNA-binding MarR family transcriptional regulator